MTASACVCGHPLLSHAKHCSYFNICECKELVLQAVDSGNQVVCFMIAFLFAGAGINPDLILFVFLPALLFESSFAMHFHQIKVCVTEITGSCTDIIGVERFAL